MALFSNYNDLDVKNTETLLDCIMFEYFYDKNYESPYKNILNDMIQNKKIYIMDFNNILYTIGNNKTFGIPENLKIESNENTENNNTLIEKFLKNDKTIKINKNPDDNNTLKTIKLKYYLLCGKIIYKILTHQNIYRHLSLIILFYITHSINI